MGHLMRKKLKSRRGVTMIMAMLFLLVCSAVGSVVLSAASANAGHIYESWTQEQKYLAVASAVNLLKDDLSNMEYKLTYSAVNTETTVEDESADGHDTNYLITYSLDENVLNNSDILSDYLNEKITVEVGGSPAESIVMGSKYSFLPVLFNAGEYNEPKPFWQEENIDLQKSTDLSAFTAVIGKEKKPMAGPYKLIARVQPGGPETNDKGMEIKIPPVLVEFTIATNSKTEKPLTIHAKVYVPEDGHKTYCTEVVFPSNIKPGEPEKTTESHNTSEAAITVKTGKRSIVVDWKKEPTVRRILEDWGA